MRSPLRLVALSTVSALVLAGCGGSDSKPTASPQQRLKDSAAALVKVKGFHFEGSATDKDGASEIEGDARADGSLRVVLRQKGEAEVRTVGGKGYIKANEDFWTANADAKIARVLADKWVITPPGTFAGPELERFKPTVLAACLTRTVGTIEDGGTSEVNGTPVTILKSAGDAPGSSPGSISIASEGAPYPLRTVQDGPRKPGGKLDPRCEDKDDSTTKSDVKLSDFGVTDPIEVPPNAIDISKLQGATDTSS